MSTAARRSVGDRGCVFFNQAHSTFQLADFLIQGGVPCLVLLSRPLFGACERLQRRFQGLFLPWHDLDRRPAVDANSLNVRALRRAVSATFALNSVLCCCRLAIAGLLAREWDTGACVMLRSRATHQAHARVGLVPGMGTRMRCLDESPRGFDGREIVRRVTEDRTRAPASREDRSCALNGEMS